MIQFDLDQVRGLGYLGATDWEMVVIFRCCERTIKLRRVKASVFRIALLAMLHLDALTYALQRVLT